MKIEDRGYSQEKIESNIMMLQVLDVLNRGEKYGSQAKSAYSGPYFTKMLREGLIDQSGFVTEKARMLAAIPVREENVYSIIKRDNDVFVLSNATDESDKISPYRI